jgi:hypothetical protein
MLLYATPLAKGAGKVALLTTSFRVIPLFKVFLRLGCVAGLTPCLDNALIDLIVFFDESVWP